MSFESQRRLLPTHKWHVHPAARNVKRRGAEPPNQDHSKKLWSDNEIALLKGLDLKFKNHKYPNIEISKVLTAKTIDQIKYKSKIMKTNVETSLKEASQETEGAHNLADPFRGIEEVIIPISNVEESSNEWISDMINEIEALTEVSSQMRDMYDQIKNIWSENKTSKEVLMEKVNEFIVTHLNRTLSNYIIL
jgi:hypothetical protein